jgi:hypothetical protein
VLESLDRLERQNADGVRRIVRLIAGRTKRFTRAAARNKPRSRH